jgi:hypothetical protein
LFRHFLDPPVDGSILVHSAGGIRTHGLELMRLARTAAPLPRKAHRNFRVQESGRQDSNLCSPVPETGGVAILPYDQMGGASTTLESNQASAGVSDRCGPALARRRNKVSPGGFEPPPSTVAGWRSAPLSYGEKRWSSGESNPEFTGASRACSR